MIRKLKILSCATVLSLSLLVPQYGFSQEAEDADVVDQLSLGDLLTIKLTSGSFLELDLTKSPLSMSVISSEMIRSSGARNMSELLEIYVPGFQYMYNKWNGTLWGLRGVANDRNTKILYLVNGHKMNTQARDGFQSETQLALLGDVERIEVLRGPAGLVYGSGAIGGIINVVTKKADGNKINVTASTNTTNSRSVEANIYATPSDDQKISISAGFRQSDGLQIGKSRIYGNAGWPGAPTGKAGGPSDGNFGSTPGDWKVAGEWGIKNFDLYFRATRQIENAGGLFIFDPWPAKVGTPDSTAKNVTIDGQTIKYNDSYYKGSESYTNSQRQYLSENIMVEGNYNHPIGENELKLKLGFDRNTTRIGVEIRDRYAPHNTNINQVLETFGEARYSLNAMYLLKSVPKLQLAAGIEYRLDHLGDDMYGKNEVGMNPKRSTITEITYNTFSPYAEGFYDITDMLGVHLGARADLHTISKTFDPKLALVFRPNEEHSIKAIYQTSSNNGTGDNYEYNRHHLDANGNVYNYPHFETATRPGTNSFIQPAPTSEVLHKLKSEKVHSWELTYVGVLFSNLTIAPSASIGYVKDLFGWSQSLFTVVNVGEYKYFNFDADLKYENKFISIGANHTFQKPIGTDVDKQGKIYKLYEMVKDSAGGYSRGTSWVVDTIIGSDTMWIPVCTQSKDLPINLVQNTITYDGDHFLSLNTNVTKLFATITPFPWMSIHTNLRLFWGLPGRSELVKDDSKYNYWGFYGEKEDLGIKDYIMQCVSKKWNFGINFNLPADIGVSLFAYDILGVDRHSGEEVDKYTINTIRWQQMGEPAQKDLYSTDQRSFGLSITKGF